MKQTLSLAIALFVTVPIVAFAQTPSASPSASPAATPASSPSAETATISIPAGWIAKKMTVDTGSFTIMNMWYAPPPAMTGDNVNLGYSPNPTAAQLDAVVPAVKAGLEQMLGAKNLTVSHAEKLCNGTADGWYFEGTFAMGAMNLTSQEVVLPGKSRIFAATYTRRAAEKDDPSARKALDSLCINA